MLWIALQAWSEDAQPVPELSQALAWQALALTPRVALARDAALMEVSASLRLFGGLRGLLLRLHSNTHDLVQPGRLHAAPGPTSPVALGRLRLAQPWKAVARLPASDLPLAVLDAACPHLDALERLGCRLWGDLRRLPRDGLARRLGAALLDALDQAWGDRAETQHWLQLPEVFEDRLELAFGVEHSTGLLFALQRLLQRLKAWLLARSLGVLGVRLVWQMDARRGVDREGELLLRLGEPTQDMAHIARLAAEHLARVQLPAPAQWLSLHSLQTAALGGQSRSLLPDEQRRGESLGQLVERLGARLGPARVLHWQAHASHVPERMQQWRAWSAGELARDALNPTRSQRQKRPSQAVMPASPPGGGRGWGPATVAGLGATALSPSFAQAGPDRDALLPTWLLQPPLRLSMRADRPCYDGPLALLVGPQRLEVSGWAPVAQTAAEDFVMRDYFIARSPQAGLLWIYREHLPASQAAWFLHGIFA
jgi:protein ImuB